MLLHKGMPDSSDRIAILPCPGHPAGWNTLALTHCRCMHIWLEEQKFPDILEKGTWQATGIQQGKSLLFVGNLRINPG